MYIYNECDRLYDFTHKSDRVCSLVQLHHPVLKISQSIVLHAIIGSLVRNDFRII